MRPKKRSVPGAMPSPEKKSDPAGTWSTSQKFQSTAATKAPYKLAWSPLCFKKKIIKKNTPTHPAGPQGNCPSHAVHSWSLEDCAIAFHALPFSVTLYQGQLCQLQSQRRLMPKRMLRMCLIPALPPFQHMLCKEVKDFSQTTSQEVRLRKDHLLSATGLIIYLQLMNTRFSC